ncbi:MAG: PKD domain-containing protein [Muribaculaceae bacterium]
MKKTIAIIAAMLAAAAVQAQNTKYIAQVYDFMPAPGQFVNEIPEWEDGDTHATILAKVGEQIIGGASNGMISLGGYGGYVVFGFDHPVVNVSGERDFMVYGNSVFDSVDKNYVSGEPGIVMVSVDANGNGEPDDEWYELAGSDYNASGTVHGYKITYVKPDADRALNADPDPDDATIIDRTYIKWTTNCEAEPEGYVKRNSFHTTNSYWPNWIEDDELTFEGTRLECLVVNIATQGLRYATTPRAWGYVDDMPNSDNHGFDIGWAVDADGNAVNLPSIDFVKVYTAVNHEHGWIGEISTEITGAEDLHPSANVEEIAADGIKIAGCEGAVKVIGARQVAIYTIGGALAARFEGDGEATLSPALYVVRADSRVAMVQVR